MFEYPSETDITSQQKIYLQSQVFNFETALKSTNFADTVNGYRKYASEKTFIGEGKVGDYTLSQDFIDAIRTNSTWAQYDENELNTAGYAHTQD